jgi:two-component system, NarL family, sensor histidine kinase DesK
MEQPWGLRLTMGGLSGLPAVPATFTVVHLAAGGVPRLGLLLFPVLALLVGAVHGVFWLAGPPAGARITLACVSVGLTLAAVASPGASAGAFLLWAYPAVMVGMSVPPPWSRVAVGALIVAVAGLTVVRSWTGRSGSAAFVSVEATAVVGCAGAAALAVAQLSRANAALRRAEAHLGVLAVEQERARVARDLHDLLGQSLSLIMIKLQVLRDVLADPDRAGTEVTELEQLTRRALLETREAVGGYRQPTLAAEAAGAEIALEAAGIDLVFADATGPLPHRVEAVLAWSLREAITNVVRHSAATRCRIRLADDGRSATLAVTDDGRGVDAGAVESGLHTLRERVDAAGGRMGAGNGAERGFVLTVSLPLDPAACR